MSNATIDAETLRKTMAERGHTQWKAARASGVSRSQITQVLGGGNPTITTACKLADYCKCGLDDLVRWPR